MSNQGQSYQTKGFQREEILVNSVKTVVYSAGTGRPLVYFHGAGTFYGIDFARDWLEDYKVYLPFHPGFGESGDLEGLSSINDYVVHYEALFAEIGLDKFSLIGLSMGGWLAAEYSLRHPEQITKLVLAAPGGIFDPVNPPANFSVMTPDDVLDHLVTDLDDLAPYLPKSQEQADWLASNDAREGQTFSKVAPKGPFNAGLEEQLSSLQIPSLLLWGKGDRILPVGMSSKWTKVIPDIQLELIDEIGHLVFVESVYARQLVLEFLK